MIKPGTVINGIAGAVRGKLTTAFDGTGIPVASRGRGLSPPYVCLAEIDPKREGDVHDDTWEVVFRIHTWSDKDDQAESSDLIDRIDTAIRDEESRLAVAGFKTHPPELLNTPIWLDPSGQWHGMANYKVLVER